MKTRQINREDYEDYQEWYEDYVISDQYALDVAQVNKDMKKHGAKLNEILTREYPDYMTEEDEAILSSLYTDLMKRFDYYEEQSFNYARQMFGDD